MKLFKKINNSRKRLLRDQILKDLKLNQPKTVLDNGCGEDGSWDYSKTPNLKITKIDKIYGQDSTKLDFPDNSFDCVVFTGVIQYLSEPIKSIQECYRVLKKNGTLIFPTINSNSLINNIKGFKKETLVFTQSGIKEIIVKNNFKQNNFKSIDFKFIPRSRKMIIYIVANKK